MASIYPRGGKLWCRLKGLKSPGKWASVPTPHVLGEERQAITFTEKAQRGIDRRLAGGATHGPATFRAYMTRWIDRRRKMDLDWKADESRLRIHVEPVLGPMMLAEIRTRDIVALFETIRSYKGDARVSSRTVYNIYAVVSALFRDAKLDDAIEQTPCCLDERQLGPKQDKDPEWRATAVFSREEATTLITSPLIPADRRVVYALELLAGVRCGEAAALRWRHYDATIAPLGRLLVAHAYSTRKNREKGTKTDVAKHVPVHPALAAILAAWREHGWAAVYGRAPEPDDLIVPLPLDATARRRSRSGEAFRGFDYSGKRWREADLPALGWRHRRHYDMRATFITLALEDDADPSVIETQVTHTKKSRSAFDGYKRGAFWAAACREVAKLKIEVLATSLLQQVSSSRDVSEKVVEAVGVEAERWSGTGRESPTTQRKDGPVSDRRTPYRPRSVASLATALAEAVLAGDELAARRLALEVRARGKARATAATRRPAVR